MNPEHLFLSHFHLSSGFEPPEGLREGGLANHSLIDTGPEMDRQA